VIKTILLNSDLHGPAARMSDYLTPQVDALRRFTLTTPIEEPVLGRAVKVPDGVVECGWFDDVDAMLQAFACRNLADLARPGAAQLWAATENVVVPGPQDPFPPSGVKLTAFVKRAGQYSPEAFQRYWRVEHAPLVPKTPRLRRYVQSHLLLEQYGRGEPICDGTAELWWDTVEDYRASWASEEVQVEQSNDAAKFIGSGPFIFVGKETLVRDSPTSTP